MFLFGKKKTKEWQNLFEELSVIKLFWKYGRYVISLQAVFIYMIIVKMYMIRNLHFFEA